MLGVAVLLGILTVVAFGIGVVAHLLAFGICLVLNEGHALSCIK
jgi:hypothetical protein